MGPLRPTDRPSLRRGEATPSGWLVAVLLLLIGALVFQLFQNVFFANPDLDPEAEPRPVTPRGDLAADEQARIELVSRVSRSVVHVTSQTIPDVSMRATDIQQGTGSGFVWNKDGHVVTNFHVVQNANRVIVTLGGTSSYLARVVGVDPDHDLAVLKIDAPDDELEPVEIGRSSDLRVGQNVYAIGNPFGLQQSLSTGVISGLGREIESMTGRPIQGVIQTDAAINPGNSGGPLLDSAGRLIGVNTAIVSPSGAYAGIGFAVPVDRVNETVPQLIRKGSVDRPGLGVVIFSDELIEELVERDIMPRRGVLVRFVAEDGAAEAAGLQGTVRNDDGTIDWGDLITKIDDRDVAGQRDLYRVLDDRSVGDTVDVTVLRDGVAKTMPVVLQSLPNE